jgi:hypothetical protein
MSLLTARRAGPATFAVENVRASLTLLVSEKFQHRLEARGCRFGQHGLRSAFEWSGRKCRGQGNHCQRDGVN